MRALLRRWRSPFRPYEQRLIDALAERLGPEARALLAGQREQVNLVQRQAGDKEVNLYAMKRGKPAFDEDVLFPMRQEAKLATVTFKAVNTAKPLRATFWSVNGHLFSLEFNRSPSGLRPEDIEIGQVDVLVDPMISGSVAGPRNAPLDATLPSDYADLVTQTAGSHPGDCRILGLSEVRSLVMEDANYHVLAECPRRGVLAIEQGGSDGEIFFFDYETTRAERVGTSLRSAIERVLKTP